MSDVAAALGVRARRLRADLLTEDHPQHRPLRVDALTNNSGIRIVTLLGLFFVGWTFLLMIVALAFPNVAPRYGTWLAALSVILPAVGSYLFVAGVVERRWAPVELAPRRMGGLLLGLLVGASLLAICLGLASLLGGWQLGGLKPTSQVAWNHILAVAGLQAAVVEEIIFRGVVLRFCEEWVGTWAALALSAVLFGAAHFLTPGAHAATAVAIALEAGLLFGALYLLTRSLWVVMGLHLGWNVAQALLTGVVSGNQTHGWLVSAPHGPAWLSGGAYGLEASAVTVVLLTCIGIGLCLMVRSRGLVVPPGWVRRDVLGTDDAAAETF